MLMYLKLRSGDELFGEGEASDDAMLRLLHPWRLLLSAKGYVPMPMPLDYLDVKDTDVLISGVVDKELEAAYLSHGSGIVTPPTGLLVPGGG